MVHENNVYLSKEDYQFLFKRYSAGQQDVDFGELAIGLGLANATVQNKALTALLKFCRELVTSLLTPQVAGVRLESNLTKDSIHQCCFRVVTKKLQGASIII